MIFCKRYSVFIWVVFLLVSCTSKKTIHTSSKETASLSSVYGITPMYIYYRANLLIARNAEEFLKKKKEFVISDTIITHKGTTAINLEELDKNFSYLIDHFKDERGEYLILSVVNSDRLESSSDFNIVTRNAFLIYDLLTRKKYKYTSSNGLRISTKQSYKQSGNGMTIKSIDVATKTIVFEQNHNTLNLIKVAMDEVASF